MSKYILSAEGRATIQSAIDSVQGGIDEQGNLHSREATHLEAVKEQFAVVCSKHATEEDARKLAHLMWVRTAELREETKEAHCDRQLLEGLIAFNELGADGDELITVN